MSLSETFPSVTQSLQYKPALWVAWHSDLLVTSSKSRRHNSEVHQVQLTKRNWTQWWKLDMIQYPKMTREMKWEINRISLFNQHCFLGIKRPCDKTDTIPTLSPFTVWQGVVWVSWITKQLSEVNGGLQETKTRPTNWIVKSCGTL